MLGNLWMLCLCLCFSALAEASIWAWMLNMPHSPPKEGAKALRESAPVVKATTVRYSTLHEYDASLEVIQTFIQSSEQKVSSVFV